MNEEQMTIETAKWILKYMSLQTEKNELDKRIENATNKVQYIIDYGFDYDGLNTVESLKGLIDMLVDYARETKNILDNKDRK